MWPSQTWGSTCLFAAFDGLFVNDPLFYYPQLLMRYWEGKTVQLSNVALLSFSNILSPELAIILELMSGFCALELGICFKSLTGKT